MNYREDILAFIFMLLLIYMAYDFVAQIPADSPLRNELQTIKEDFYYLME